MNLGEVEDRLVERQSTIRALRRETTCFKLSIEEQMTINGHCLPKCGAGALLVLPNRAVGP